MKRRQILLDDESDRILDGMAQVHSGNRSLAVREALKTHKTVESMLREMERVHGAELRRQKARSERSFRNGTAVPWEQVKKRSRL
ncbi:MAG TPA: hypothetical protein VK335_06265 [Bryobacteraceae bacterium]|nr:hypothetical protein [Bryobacteraceae bacterium]